MNYIKGVIGELKKVSWPENKEAVRLTLITVLVAAGVSIAFFVIDTAFLEGLRAMIGG